jgi:multidrug resistance efflux pump
VTAEGVVRPADEEKVISKIHLENWFRPTLEELVPEWSLVKEGDMVGRLYTPSLADERAEKEQQLRLAEAIVLKTEADAYATLAGIESELLSARARLQDAQERLGALKDLPESDDVKELTLRMADNETRREHARRQSERLQDLGRFGLCSALEIGEADHVQAKLTSEGAYLEASFARLQKQGSAFEKQKADVAAQKAALEVRIAEARKEAESKRQPLRCEAVRLEKVGPARRDLELTKRRLDALTLRAPRAGFVVYGYRWDAMGTEKLSAGKPVFFGQSVASIVDVKKLQVWTKVTEREILRLAVGDRAQVTFEAVPGAAYEGAVEQVFPVIRSDKERFLTTDVEALERYGTVLVRLRDPDERVRPGMNAKVSIAPGGDNGTARQGAGDSSVGQGAAAGRAGRQGMVFKGWLKASATRFVRSPFNGRVVWAAEQGAPVQAGDTVLRLDPGLEVDWLAEVADELKRLGCLRQAAELNLRLTEQTAPLPAEVARADVRMAELSLEELQAYPEAPERIAAENQLAEAEWQCRQAGDQRDAYVRLQSEGMASQTDVRRRQLRFERAEAAVVMAQANLDEVKRGASEVELALARANLKLAQTSLRKATSYAEADVKAATAALAAAQAKLAAYREKAERKRKKAEQAELKAPINGVVLYRFVEEGEEVREGFFLMMLADTTRSEVHTAVDEPDYFRVPLGSPAVVRLAGVPDRTFAGHVSAVTDWQLPFWDSQRRPDEKVRPGKLFEVTVELEDQPPRCVGMSAVVEIFPLDNGGAVRGAVTPGAGGPDQEEGRANGSAD